VRYNEYRAIIDIQTGKVTGQMPRPAPRLRVARPAQGRTHGALDLVALLAKNWERMENGETLAKINPLD
jgi:hypothetical protein